jgi:hypothetical protein
MNTLRKMDHTGDSPVATWTPTDTDAVTLAERAFQDLRGMGFAAFRLDPTKPGSPGRQITVFDATAPEILMIPALIGG